MDYKYVVTDVATHEREAIVKYLIELTGVTSAARRFNEEYLHIIDILKSNPFLFGLSRMEELSRQQIRTLFVRNYVVLYTVKEDAFIIMHIFHQSQNHTHLI